MAESPGESSRNCAARPVAVVIELLKSIVDYFEIHRLKLTLILDAALVFTRREVMIGVYRHTLHAADVGALSGLLLVISAGAPRAPRRRLSSR